MLKVTVKGIFTHRLRFALTALAVCLGVALVAGTLVLSGSINRTFDGIVEQTTAGTDVQVRGAVIIDDGAARVLAREGKSLLPIGVTACRGEFDRGEVVSCVTADGREIARGLINYSSQETQRILRRPSGEIESILGYVDDPELIHRDNMVVL